MLTAPARLAAALASTLAASGLASTLAASGLASLDASSATTGASPRASSATALGTNLDSSLIKGLDSLLGYASVPVLTGTNICGVETLGTHLAGTLLANGKASSTFRQKALSATSFELSMSFLGVGRFFCPTCPRNASTTGASSGSHLLH